MTRDILIDLLGRQPFASLALTLSNDATITIDSPENVRVGRNYLVVDGAGDQRQTITLHHVLMVTSRSEPKLEAYEEDAADTSATAKGATDGH